MQDVIRRQENLSVIEDEVYEILIHGGRVTGLRTACGILLYASVAVITTGTFLNGRMHTGTQIIPGGRVGEPAANRLADNIRDLGFEVLLFKTGTPPRLDGRTIDFSQMEIQHSDERPLPFSFRASVIPQDQPMLPCYITKTCEATHDIIRAHMHLSPMYSGQIQATGVRYCPSIEDKIKKFGDKPSHQVFLEPEGIDTDEYYPNGISTGLPVDVQEKMVRSIKGLETARMIRPGYSIEHGVIPATELTPFMETRKVKGLFLAGQINGTTGYEEAAAQGIMAGINAALQVKGEPPLILGRHESYIGVLIDDLTTKGTDEPYRMFTSRVEYRLVVREDNADKRMVPHGYRLGLISRKDYERVCRKYDSIQQEIDHLQSTLIPPGTDLDRILQDQRSSPLKRPSSLRDILKRPHIRYHMISGFDGQLRHFSPEVIDQVEYEIKYEGFIQRQLKDIDRFRHIEVIKIPEEMDYDCVSGLSTEVRQKLKRFQPLNLGQANRISGVTPAAISILMVYLRKFKRDLRAHCREDSPELGR
jgi:tRNA uridine 5-carboxymethylaminomethyl modification enzyme